MEADQLLNGLIHDAHRFTSAEVFEDDVCLLGITRPPAESEA